MIQHFIEKRKRLLISDGGFINSDGARRKAKLF